MFMKLRILNFLQICVSVFFLVIVSQTLAKAQSGHRYLYVATPGIRDYLGYGGHGILVFDMQNNHRFCKKDPNPGPFTWTASSWNVKGIAVSIPLNSIYVSTLESLQRIDLTTDKVIWERKI